MHHTVAAGFREPIEVFNNRLRRQNDTLWDKVMAVGVVAAKAAFPVKKPTGDASHRNGAVVVFQLV